MPYVGNPLANAFSSREKQDLTGQSGTSFTLTHSVSHANDLSVYINHVRQEPTTAYSVNGTTLTTTGSVAGTDDFYIIYDELAVQSISHPTDQALTATSGTFTSGLVGTTATFSGAVSGTTGTFSGDLTVDTSTLKVDSSNNRVGIGTTSPSSLLHCNSASGNSAITLQTANNGSSVSSNYTTPNRTYYTGIDIGGVNSAYTIYDGNASAERMRIDSSGKVLIGTTSEANTTGLGVVKAGGGNFIARFQNTTAGTPYGVSIAEPSGASAGYPLLNVANHNGSTTFLRVNSSNGRVGIGTDAPATPLQVRNDTDTDYNISTGTTNAVLNLKNNTSGANNCVGMSFSTESNGEWYLSAVQESSSECAFHIGARAYGSRHDRMKINSDGTVLIGNKDSNPTAWGLRVFNVHATHATIEGWNDNSSGKNLNLFRHDDASIFQVSNGGAVWAAGGFSSDKAFKNIIGDCTEGWSKLKDVQPKSYRHKRISNVEQEDGTTKEVFSDNDMDSNIHYGVIAQDLKKVLPDITYGEEGKMSVDYHGLLMVAINTIKELESRITALESK